MRQIRDGQRTARRPRPAQAVPRNVSTRGANYADTAFASYACDTTGSVTQLNVVPQSVSTTGRIGKKIALKSIQCHGILGALATTSVTQASFMLIYDRRPSGALPLITDILNSVSPNSFLNDTNSSRFKVLKREDFTIIGTFGASTTDKSAYEIDFFYKFPQKYSQTSYKALGTGAIADVDEGAIYLVTVGSSAGTAAATFQSGWRLRFYDESG